MSNIDSVINKISTSHKYIKILKRYNEPVAELVQSIDRKAAVERYLYLAIQACIDVAEGLIALEKFRKPRSYRECFEILEEEGILPADLSLKFKKNGFL